MGMKWVVMVSIMSGLTLSLQMSKLRELLWRLDTWKKLSAKGRWVLEHQNIVQTQRPCLPWSTWDTRTIPLFFLALPFFGPSRIESGDSFWLLVSPTTPPEANLLVKETARFSSCLVLRTFFPLSQSFP
jgi:hypothetical protein